MKYEPKPLAYTIGTSLFRAYFRIFHKLKIYGSELCPIEGPLIIAANHASMLDPPLVAVVFKQRRVRFIAKKELWKSPFLSWYLTNVGMIPVDRGGGGRAAIEKAVEYASSGSCVGIFPEGTRTKDGNLQKGRSGAIYIAARSKARILPAYIEGTFECFPAGSKKVKKLPITIYIGDSFELTEQQADITDREQVRNTAAFIMERIAAAKTKYTDTQE